VAGGRRLAATVESREMREAAIESGFAAREPWIGDDCACFEPLLAGGFAERDAFPSAKARPWLMRHDSTGVRIHARKKGGHGRHRERRRGGRVRKQRRTFGPAVELERRRLPRAAERADLVCAKRVDDDQQNGR